MKAVIRQGMEIGKVVLAGVCLVGAVTGCSSRLQTTVMSSTEPEPAPRVVEQVTPISEGLKKPVVVEEAKGIARIDIPVEEPARPVIRPVVPKEIFATPRTEVVTPEMVKTPEPPVVVPEPSLQPPMTEPAAPSLPSDIPQTTGIPPVVMEPELPTLPTLREGKAPPQELVAKVEPEHVQEIPPIPSPEEPKIVTEQPKVEEREAPPPPIEVAKVIPPSPEIVETMLKPLGDVYFDYDRFSIRPDAMSVLKENAKNLVDHLADTNIVIEGHCDERGTSSYNMVLGERRANSVKEFLVALGVPAERLQAMSFGKERPVCTDQTEECWQENRRGHFVLK